MTSTADQLVRQLREGRRWTGLLLDPLTDDELHRSHSRIMSPLVWDMGHIANFEELWLLRALGDTSLADPDLDRVYNPFDNPRWVRADLPILPRAEAGEYLAEVRDAALRLLRATGLDPDEPLLAHGRVHQMVLQHEAQHQETMLQALDLRGDTHGQDADEVADPDDPRFARYAPAMARTLPPARSVDDREAVVVPGGTFLMGAPDTGAALSSTAPPTALDAAVAAYDNERPRHAVDVPTFAIERFPVTARRFAAFIADGGYHDQRWWTPRGLAWQAETGHTAPQGWLPQAGGGWLVRRFNRLDPLDPRELVEHVTRFEAEAFAAWAGGRLPTEVEWEKAAAHDPATGSSRPFPWGDAPPTPVLANLDRRLWGPSLVGSYPQGASAHGVEHLLGDGYEWTSSPFEPYEGYMTFPYPEYSEVFFGGDWSVLRGASWATRPTVARTTFRNWDHPYRRQIFSSVRVAYDVASDGRVMRAGR